jgi:hypothetical protein
MTIGMYWVRQSYSGQFSMNIFIGIIDGTAYVKHNARGMLAPMAGRQAQAT